MSTAPRPSRDTDPSTAVDAVVTRDRTSLFNSITTSTWSPANTTSVTLPISMPATRTGDPVFSPATLANRVFRE
jgi:hypothetical protein